MTATLSLTLMLALPGQLLVAPPFQQDPAVRLTYMKRLGDALPHP